MKKGISGSTLKFIAIATMFLDHLGAVLVLRMVLWGRNLGNLSTDTLYAIYEVLRFIGRVSFPIFCFLLVEGFLHTKCAWKYALRLFLFALLSEIPFDLALQNTITERTIAFSYQNVLFTMLIGFLVMMALEYIKAKEAFSKVLRIIAGLLVVALGCLISELLHTDYAVIGIIVIAAFFFLKNNRFLQVLSGVILFSWEFPAPFGMLPVLVYNGERGLKLKYFFYIFYPLHLLVLYFIAKGLGLG